MKNKFGNDLDRNGYAESIIGEQDRCYLCGRRNGKLDRHEVFNASNRDKSKNLGLWVLLCSECHDRLHHRDAEVAWKLKQDMQLKAMEYYNWDIKDFRKEIGKSYI